MKITFKVEDTKLTCTIHTDAFPLVNYNHSFGMELGNKAFAALLAQYLTEKLGNEIESVRREEYEKGYRVGKQKQRKETLFFRILGK